MAQTSDRDELDDNRITVLALNKLAIEQWFKGSRADQVFCYQVDVYERAQVITATDSQALKHMMHSEDKASRGLALGILEGYSMRYTPAELLERMRRMDHE